MKINKQEIRDQLAKMLKPPRPEIIEEVANFIEQLLDGKFDADKVLLTDKEQALSELEGKRETLQAEIEAIKLKRPDLEKITSERKSNKEG